MVPSLLLALLLALTPAALTAQTRSVTGRVLDASDGRPLAGAQVAVGSHGAGTGDDGRFTLEAGGGVLVARHVGYAADSVRVAPGDEVVLRLQPAPTPLAALVVTPGHFRALDETAAPGRLLTREQIETAPQLGEDVFRAVQRLPGVSSADVSAAFSVRGSAPREVLVTLDGLELYEPYHLKDLDNALSVVDIAAIGGVDISTGGFGARHGDRLAGVFDMRSRSVPPGPATHELALSITNVRGLTRGAFADDRGRWLLSVRRGWLDLALALADADDGLSPRYQDAFGRVDWSVGRQRLSLHVLGATDAMSREDGAHQPRLESDYGSGYAWLTWAGPLAATFEQSTTLSTGRLTWQRSGRTGTGFRADPIAIHDDRALGFAGLRSDWTWTPAEPLVTRAGIDVRMLHADYDYNGWRTRPVVVDGRIVGVTDTVRVALSRDAVRTGAYLIQRVRPHPTLALEAGLRHDRLDRAGAGLVQPRVHVAWSPDARTTVRAGTGVYAQTPGLHELQVQDADTLLGGVERAVQHVVGVERRIGADITLRAEAWTRRVRDPRPYYVNLDNTTDVFPEFALSRRRVDPTQGTAKGLELALGDDGRGTWTWSAGWALSEAWEWIEGRRVSRPRDQRHAAALDLAWSARTGWRISAAWQIHSGWPRTLADVRLDPDAHANGIVLVERLYGDYNAARLPAYHRLDARVTRQWQTRRGRVAVFVDLFNAYGRDNPRGYTPSLRLGPGGVVSATEEAELFLPRLPGLGVVWTF